MDFSDFLKDFANMNDDGDDNGDDKPIKPFAGISGMPRPGNKTIGDIPDDESTISKASRPSLSSIFADFGDNVLLLG